MPFKSQAQRAKFYADPKLRRYIPEFEADTPASLPKRLRVPRKHSASSASSAQRVPDKRKLR